MNDNDMVCLEITSWVGIGIGAQHVYGTLVGYSNGEYTRVELKRKLNAKSAEALNEKHKFEFPGDEDPYKYRPGYITKGFDTRAQVIKKAKSVWKEHFPKARVLVMGSFSVGNPQRVLVAPSDFKETVNALWREDERIGGYEGNPERSEEIYRIYSKYLKSYK